WFFTRLIPTVVGGGRAGFWFLVSGFYPAEAFTQLQKQTWPRRAWFRRPKRQADHSCSSQRAAIAREAPLREIIQFKGWRSNFFRADQIEGLSTIFSLDVERGEREEVENAQNRIVYC
ncbi:MAG TPA: hypothetical protein PLU64_15400, partial [Saprospiraceae bacterium]|nr:hypothetical protein [Saprospiraceae bacterium]